MCVDFLNIIFIHDLVLFSVQMCVHADLLMKSSSSSKAK